MPDVARGFLLLISLFIALAFPATLAFETAAGVVFGGLKQGVAIVTAAKILGAARTCTPRAPIC